jgi:hypothetical protein
MLRCLGERRSRSNWGSAPTPGVYPLWALPVSSKDKGRQTISPHRPIPYKAVTCVGLLSSIALFSHVDSISNRDKTYTHTNQR